MDVDITEEQRDLQQRARRQPARWPSVGQAIAGDSACLRMRLPLVP